MSRAFIKEDVEVVERPLLRRSSSGLPPGALNLMTADGAERLRERLEELRLRQPNSSAIAALEEVLQSATVVPTTPAQNSIVFGSTVRLQNEHGEQEVYRIVGVDEEDLGPQQVSWLSYLGKTLLSAAKIGQRISLEPGQRPLWRVVGIE